MFVQSKSTIHALQRNGVAIQQRRGGNETLVQWQNGDQRWVDTKDLAGEIKLIAPNGIQAESGDLYV